MRRYIYFILCFGLGFAGCVHDPKRAAEQKGDIQLIDDSPSKYVEEEPDFSSENNLDHIFQDYENPNRIIWQKPNEVIKALGDLKGKTVADIGAGTGYFAFRLIPVAEKVIAIDIDPVMIGILDSIRHQLNPEAAKRFDSRLAKADDPLLQPEEADAVILVNTYGYLEHRVEYLKIIWKGMRPGGKLLIIDFKKMPLPVGPDEEYKISSNQVSEELKAAGFKVQKLDNNTLDYQYIILSQKI